VVIQIDPCVVIYQRLGGNSNRSVSGALEVAVVEDGGPSVIFYHRL
jgi:hypothetical protein